MILKDEYIHGTEGVLKALLWNNGLLEYKRADTKDTWVALSPTPIWNQDTTGTAKLVSNSLTFTGGVEGTWNGSSAKTIAIPTKSSWNYDDRYLLLIGGIVTGPTTFELAINADILGNSTTTDRFKQTEQIGSATQPVYFNNGIPIACTSLGTASTHNHSDYVTTIGISGTTITWSKGGTALTTIQLPTYTNNITSHLYIGPKDTNTTAALSTNGNVYLKLYEGSTKGEQYQVTGGTGISITSDASGNITITNTKPDINHNTDTKVKLTATSGTATDRCIPFPTSASDITSGSAYELYYQSDFKYNPGTKLFSVPNITLSNKLIASLGEIDSLTVGNLVVQGTSSLGTITAGIWNGARLTSSYIPTDVVYTTASQELTNKTYNGYTLAAACAKGVDTSISANSTSTNLPTTAAVESRINAHNGIDKIGTVTSVSSGTGISITGTTTVNPTVNLADNYGDTKNPYASKTKKYFLAAPNDADGVPTFRAIVASDIPILNLSTTGSAATLTTSRNLWGNSFNGSASINGCIDFGETTGESLKWTSGSWWQRIYITDDTNADTAVFSFLQRPGSGDYVNLLTIRDNGTLDLHKTGSIVNLKKQGGIYWDPYIESTTDASDAASITLQTGTKIGNTTLGTVLTISQLNDSNDTIQFLTNASSKLYHNNNIILTSADVTGGGGSTWNSSITINGTTLTIPSKPTYAYDDLTTEPTEAQLEAIIGNFGGATASANGSTGLVPSPTKGDQTNKYLNAGGSWKLIAFSEISGTPTAASYYWGSLQTSSTISFKTTPEFKSVTLGNGDTSASTTGNRCRLEFDVTNKCLKFIFD